MNTVQNARGKWSSILESVGVNPDFLTGKHTSCPHCGGVDRFRFANQDGSGNYFCSQCGHGDGMNLYMKVTGMSFKDAAKKIDGVSPTLRPAPIPVEESVENKRKRLNNMMKRVRPIQESESVIKYLNGRGITNGTISQLSRMVGCINGLEYWQGKRVASRFDAMVSKVTKFHKPITYHITYTENGDKANVANARKIMPTVEKFDHGVVELFDHSHELGIAEGIETAMSCYQLFQIPTWASLNAKSLENFVPPAGVTKVYIFGDNDSGSMTGQRSSELLCQRLKFQGYEVVKNIPTESGADWNDMLMRDSSGL